MDAANRLYDALARRIRYGRDSDQPYIPLENPGHEDTALQETALQETALERADEPVVPEPKPEFQCPLPVLVMLFLLGTVFAGLLLKAAFAHSVNGSYLRYPSVEELRLLTKSSDRAKAVKSIFRFAWDGYYRAAFPHDELRPASNTSGTSRNDWGATPVDALSTAILMDLPDIIAIVLEHVKGVDFNRTEQAISVFESTIRYMGGLLSAYDLLLGPFSTWTPPGFDLDVLLIQAKSLADMLSAAFVEGQALPTGLLDPDTRKGEPKNSLAGAGTPVLEWTRLSDLVHDQKYAQLTQGAEDVLLNAQPPTAQPFPGLFGTQLEALKGTYLDSRAQWGGSADSFYEYLIKMYVYDKESFEKYKKAWSRAADSTMAFLASSPRDWPNITFLGQYDGNGHFFPESGHMTCFAGGNFLLGGMVLKQQKYTDFGLKLVNGCHHTYISTKTRIGPESFMWIPSECGKTSPPWKCEARTPEFYRELFETSGFWISEGSYNLRPEVLESYYYAYRMTKDEKYREWAWDAFIAINEVTRLENGFDYLKNVNVRSDEVELGDFQESYFFSETLKYLFLIFSDDGDWHVDQEGWVFNTEGHPLKIRT